jgi:hypothetical protein
VRIAIPLLFCLLALASCEKDIKIDLPASAPKLVLNAVVRVGDSISVNLSRTAGVKESSQQSIHPVPGATVLLYVDGQLKDTLHTVPGNDLVYTSRIVADHNKTYRLSVVAQGYETIEATANAAGMVSAHSWDYKPNAWQSSDGGSYDELGIEFQDPANSSDFYIVRIKDAYQYYGSEDQDFYSWGGCAYTSDPSIESASSDPFGGDECLSMNSILLNDALYNGQRKHLSMYVYSGALQPQEDTAGKKIYAQYYLYHVSEDFYKYVKTFRAALDADGNPFAEPVNVSSNVRNGYGIFAILDEYVEDIVI